MTKTPLGLQILTALEEHDSLYGLELVRLTRVAKESIYVTLHRMEKRREVESEVTPTPKGKQGPPRRAYRITERGMVVLQAMRLLAKAQRM